MKYEIPDVPDSRSTEVPKSRVPDVAKYRDGEAPNACVCVCVRTGGAEALGRNRESRFGSYSVWVESSNGRQIEIEIERMRGWRRLC